MHSLFHLRSIMNFCGFINSTCTGDGEKVHHLMYTLSAVGINMTPKTILAFIGIVGNNLKSSLINILKAGWWDMYTDLSADSLVGKGDSSFTDAKFAYVAGRKNIFIMEDQQLSSSVFLPLDSSRDNNKGIYETNGADIDFLDLMRYTGSHNNNKLNVRRQQYYVDTAMYKRMLIFPFDTKFAPRNVEPNVELGAKIIKTGLKVIHASLLCKRSNAPDPTIPAKPAEPGLRWYRTAERPSPTRSVQARALWFRKFPNRIQDTYEGGRQLHPIRFMASAIAKSRNENTSIVRSKRWMEENTDNSTCSIDSQIESNNLLNKSFEHLDLLLEANIRDCYKNIAARCQVEDSNCQRPLVNVYKDRSYIDRRWFEGYNVSYRKNSRDKSQVMFVGREIYLLKSLKTPINQSKVEMHNLALNKKKNAILYYVTNYVDERTATITSLIEDLADANMTGKGAVLLCSKTNTAKSIMFSSCVDQSTPGKDVGYMVESKFITINSGFAILVIKNSADTEDVMIQSYINNDVNPNEDGTAGTNLIDLISEVSNKRPRTSSSWMPLEAAVEDSSSSSLDFFDDSDFEELMTEMLDVHERPLTTFAVRIDRIRSAN
ncbi:hypothetical protein O3P69_002260 [Scylla paramamosain]|uniref:Uncharacterized protein n=1 Tax=Scylla paramamosain TaxID=85552 RepID=A0AAW0V5F8_SCYPA